MEVRINRVRINRVRINRSRPVIIIIIIFYFLSTWFTDNGRLVQESFVFYIRCGATHFALYVCVVERRMIVRPNRSVHRNGRLTFIFSAVSSLSVTNDINIESKIQVKYF